MKLQDLIKMFLRNNPGKELRVQVLQPLKEKEVFRKPVLHTIKTHILLLKRIITDILLALSINLDKQVLEPLIRKKVQSTNHLVNMTKY